ncbi:MAG: hypothetical protein WC517_03725 [Patescibacteria group bacterium]
MPKRDGTPTDNERLLKALQEHPEGITSIWIIQNLHFLNYKGRKWDLCNGVINNTCYDIECVHVSGGTHKYVLHGEKKYIREASGQLAFL